MSMEIGLVAVVGIVLVVAIAIVSSRIGVAAPLLLVVAGIGIGYLPFVPLVEIDPEIILLGVLPPLLYAAAVNVPFVDFRRNFKPVIGLSVVLVIISAVVVGVLLHLLIPAIPLPAGIALGAVVSPTDAVAATSIGKKLGMPTRLVSILEGESLVNDATSLVLLKTAVAAGSFVFWDAVGNFSFAVAAAVLIGFLMGIITVWLRSHLRNPVYDTVISFTVPFVAFIPAEYVGASGVLAVVVTGLYTGHHSAKRFSATARVNERLNWRTLQFVVENGVFLVMGLQLHSLVEQVSDSPWKFQHLSLIGIGVVLVLIICRALFLVPMLWSMRGDADRLEQRSRTIGLFAARARKSDRVDESRMKRVERMRQRSEADLAHEQEQALGWRDGAVLSWSGMRGVVTLAAAQTIPTEVPYRAQVVLIAFIVAIVTLLLHGLTLPPLIRKLWPDQHAKSDTARELSALKKDLLEAGDTALEDELSGDDAEDPDGEIDPAIIDRVRQTSKAALAPLAMSASIASTADGTESETPAQTYLRLARTVLQAQRETLIEEQAIGRYSSHTLRAAEVALDAQETRLMPPQEH